MGVRRFAVISGVGRYYRRSGYELAGSYMSKTLEEGAEDIDIQQES